NPDTNSLPARSLPSGPALSSTIGWVQTNLQIAHLPPADSRQISSFLGSGYQVLTVNTLLQWDRVGPGSADYTSDVVSNANDYLTYFASSAHAFGTKAVFYLGPVQSPLSSPQFRANHPGWLRVKPDGTTDPNYVNFRDQG